MPGGHGGEEGSLALRFCQLMAGISGRLTSNCRSVGPLAHHESTAAVPCARPCLHATPTLGPKFCSGCYAGIPASMLVDTEVLYMPYTRHGLIRVVSILYNYLTLQQAEGNGRSMVL